MRKPLIPLKSFARDNIIRSSLIWSGLLSLISLLLNIIYYHRLPPITPLFYSLSRGESQLVSKQFLFILPITSIIFFLAHAWIAKINFPTDRMFARILSVTSSMISFLFFIALIHIIIIMI